MAERHVSRRFSISCFLVVASSASINAFLPATGSNRILLRDSALLGYSPKAQQQGWVKTGFGRRRGNRERLPIVYASRDSGNDPMESDDQQERVNENMGDELFLEVQRRDWRLFRKNLIARYGEGSAKEQWAEGRWAHDIYHVEPGCLLLATEEIWDGPFRQSVILVLSHDPKLGSIGLILNRPGSQHLQTLAGLKPDLAQFFAESQVFDGGPVGLGTMTVVHSAEGAEGSEPVLPGVYAGGFDALVEMARRGEIDKSRVRFVHGHSAWAPGQLQGELNRNQWFIASAAPELVTAACDDPNSSLWGEVLRLMGGNYQEVAKRNGYVV